MGHEVALLVVADEVEHEHGLLARRLAQAAAQLLHEDDGRLRGPEHDDLVHRGDVDALVEDVDREDVLKPIVPL